jgi:hypothetical protein
MPKMRDDNQSVGIKAAKLRHCKAGARVLQRTYDGSDDIEATKL